MTQRPSARVGGTTRAAVRRPFSVALAGIAMAVAMCAFPLLSAHAETAAPGQGQPTHSPTAPAPIHTPAPADPNPAQPTVDPVPAKPPVVEPAVPVAPAPVAPAPAQAPAPELAPAPVTQPSDDAVPTDTPSSAPVPTATATASAVPSASPSASSNWDTPIQNGLTANQAASVSDAKGPGADWFAVIAVMGGVLLVAGGGIAFALWSRNRFSGH
ncbi:MAG TPA: hypothetical protein VJQ60_01835 [Arthrobacter sp.]|nr:hypothetical protein [Arthrobacter sp.]